MKKLLTLAAVAAVAAAGCTSDTGLTDPTAEASGAEPAIAQRLAPFGTRTYRVTIENLTSQQPFSPGVVATHVQGRHVFQVGGPATEGVRLIAENGDPSVAVTELTGVLGVHQVVPTTAPVGCLGCEGPFGNSLSLEIEARGPADRLSVAVMLICTNDGFTGVDGVRLPRGFQPVSYLAGSYDAGTERNDERFASIVDPCGLIGPVAVAPDGGNARTPTRNVVRRHRGILGIGDLAPGLYDWHDPVAKITVQRLQ